MKNADRRQRPPYLDLVRMLMDHQLLDANHVECGKVDDIELEIMDDGTLRATAIFTGPGAAFSHLPRFLQWLAGKVAGTHSRRLPWAELAIVDSRLKLRSTREVLGLDAAERKAAAWIAKLPGGE